MLLKKKLSCAENLSIHAHRSELGFVGYEVFEPAFCIWKLRSSKIFFTS